MINFLIWFFIYVIIGNIAIKGCTKLIGDAPPEDLKIFFTIIWPLVTIMVIGDYLISEKKIIEKVWNVLIEKPSNIIIKITNKLMKKTEQFCKNKIHRNVD
jgi:hypothetical protein